MPHNHYSDEPRLIKPRGIDQRFLGFILLIAAVVLLVGGFAFNLLYRNWQENQSHLAERGMYEGALYAIEVDGQTANIELGWRGNHLLPVLHVANFDDVVLHIKGSFGEETLRPDPRYKSLAAFGPTSAELAPFKHYRLQLRIERNGQILWAGRLWAWGVHYHHH